MEGESTTFDLGGLNASEAGPFTVTVQWGDNQSSSFVQSGSGALDLAHIYSDEGMYTISETVSDTSGVSTAITFANPVVVVDQPVVVAAPPVPLSGTLGTPTGNVLVATFTDPEGADSVDAYKATITVGDPTEPAGTITYDCASGVFSVYANLTFDQPGSESITVTISHGEAQVGTTVIYASVAPASSSTVLATPSSVQYGQTATFTATVTGYGTPTGTVAFYSGAVNSADQIGSGTLSIVNGQNEATYSTASLSVSGGPYAITAVYSGDTDNQGSYSNLASQIVTPAPLSITAVDQTKAYGAALPTLTASYSGFVNGDTPASLTALPTLSTTATGGSHVSGSPYSITAAGAVDSNYAITYMAGSLAVTPVDLTITASNQTKVYGAALPALAATYSGFVNGDTCASLTTQPTLSTTATAASHVAGSPYAINVSGASDSDYTISYVAGALTVTPAPLTMTASNQSKVYGAVLPGLTAAYSGFVNGDSAASLTTQPTLSTTATVASHVAGSPYAINVSGASDSDYTISYAAGTLTVTPAPLTITASSQTKVYGAALPSLTAAYSGFVNGDSSSSLTTLPTLSTTATAASHVVGSPYAINVNGASDSDYSISYAAGSLTVTPAPLTITASNQTKVYGAALPTLTAAYSGFVNGDSSSSLTTLPTLSTAATAASHVAGNPYAINVSGAADSDYSISYVAGTLTVTPAPLTITASNQSKVYGAALPTLTAAYSGFVNGDTSSSLTTKPTLSTTATAASHVAGNPYAINVSGASDSDYTISYAAGTLTVTTAPLTITASNQTKVYGAALPTLTAAYSGFVNGDSSSSLTTLPTLSTTATAASHVAGNPYAINVSGASDSDYTIGYVSGTLIVTPAPLTITASNQTKVYGAALPTLTAAYSGFVNGDTSSSLTTKPSLSTTATTASHIAGNPYAINIGGAADSDYSISYVAGTLTVTPAPLTIAASNQTKVYGAALPTLTAAYSGFVNGDTSSSLTTQPTLSTTATAASHVAGNPYAINVGGAADSDYAISYVAGTLTVTPAPLTITASNQTKVYGAALPTLTAAYSGFVNGDTSSSFTTKPTLSTTATAASSVSGSPYAITASGALDTDYSISYVAGTLTVTPAALTITANSQTKVYGQANPALTVSFSGLVNGDTSASLTTQPAVSTTATTSSAVGTYAINVSGAADPNYTISYVAATLTINKDATSTSATASTTSGSMGQSLTITATVTASAPGSGTPTGTALFVDATTGDQLGDVALASGVATLSTTALAPGSHSITVTYSGDTNFLTSSTTTSTITMGQSIIVLDPTAGGSESLGEREHQDDGRSVRRFELLERDPGQRQCDDQRSGDRRARGGLEERQRELQPGAGDQGRRDERSVRGTACAEHDRPDEFWFVLAGRELEGDDQPGHLHCDQRVGQRDPDDEPRDLHHRGGRLHGLGQRGRDGHGGDDLQRGQRVPLERRKFRSDQPERQRHVQAHAADVGHLFRTAVHPTRREHAGALLQRQRDGGHLGNDLCSFGPARRERQRPAHRGARGRHVDAQRECHHERCQPHCTAGSGRLLSGGGAGGVRHQQPLRGRNRADDRHRRRF